MGVYLSEPIKTKDSEHAENGELRYGAVSMQGWRNQQEDAHVAKLDLPDGGHLFGVFDGHGGKEVSIFVEKYFTEEFCKQLAYKQGRYEEALKVIMHRMDEMLLAKKGIAELKKICENDRLTNPKFDPARLESDISKLTGCTAVVCLVTKEHIFCANSGDSRAILVRGDDPNSLKVDPLSYDHKPENAEERARIEAAGGYVENNRVNGALALSRSIGDFEYKSNTSKNYKEQMVTCLPEIIKLDRSPKDRFMVLACDGIWDCLSNEACAAMLQQHLLEKADPASDPRQTAVCVEKMFDKILAQDIISSQGLGTDNMTCILCEFK